MTTLRLLAASLLLLTVSGCTRVVFVAPMPPALPASRIPLDVGLYLPREFKAYQAEIRDADPWVSLDLWRYVNLGAASAQQFERELAGTFRSVQVLDEAPSAARPARPGLAAVMEPGMSTSTWFSGTCSGRSPLPFGIASSCTVRMGKCGWTRRSREPRRPAKARDRCA